MTRRLERRRCPAKCVRLSPPDLLEAAQSNYPVLKQRERWSRNRPSVELARREAHPDFSVGYVYMQRDAQPDMKGITFSATLPVFRHSKQNLAIVEAVANLDSSRAWWKTNSPYFATE